MSAELVAVPTASLGDLLTRDVNFVDDAPRVHLRLPRPRATPFTFARTVATRRTRARATSASPRSSPSTSQVGRSDSRPARPVRSCENLLCQDVPGAAAGAAAAPCRPTGTAARAVRRRSTAHDRLRARATRSSTRSGLGLENFDASGASARRTRWRPAPIDATGALPDGTPFDGLVRARRPAREGPALPRLRARARRSSTRSGARSPPPTTAHVAAIDARWSAARPDGARPARRHRPRRPLPLSPRGEPMSDRAPLAARRPARRGRRARAAVARVVRAARGARRRPRRPPRSFVAMYVPERRAPTTGSRRRRASGDAWTLSPILEPLAPVKPYVNVLANVGNYGPFGGHVEPSNSNLTAAVLDVHARPHADQRARPSGRPSISSSRRASRAARSSTRCRSASRRSTRTPTACRRPARAASRGARPRSRRSSSSIPRPSSTSSSASARPPGARARPFAAARPRQEQERPRLRPRPRGDGAATSVGVSDRRAHRHVPDARCASSRPRIADEHRRARVRRPAAAHGRTIAVGNVPADYNRDTHANLMIDLVVMALQCDVTRVVSFMLDDARSDFVYNFLPSGASRRRARRQAPGPSRGLDGLCTPATPTTATRRSTSGSSRSSRASPRSSRPARTATATCSTPRPFWFGSEMHGANNRRARPASRSRSARAAAASRPTSTSTSPRRARQDRAPRQLATSPFMRGVFDMPIATFGTAPPAEPRARRPSNRFGAGTTVIPEILV